MRFIVDVDDTLVDFVGKVKKVNVTQTRNTGRSFGDRTEEIPTDAFLELSLQRDNYLVTTKEEYEAYEQCADFYENDIFINNTLIEKLNEISKRANNEVFIVSSVKDPTSPAQLSKQRFIQKYLPLAKYFTVTNHKEKIKYLSLKSSNIVIDDRLESFTDVIPLNIYNIEIFTNFSNFNIKHLKDNFFTKNQKGEKNSAFKITGDVLDSVFNKSKKFSYSWDVLFKPNPTSDFISVVNESYLKTVIKFVKNTLVTEGKRNIYNTYVEKIY